MHLLRQLINPIARTIRSLRDSRRRYHDEPLPQEIYHDHIPKRTISFCTTCMNRFFHLRETFLRNVDDNRTYPAVEFVLLNYNSQDELHHWALKHLPPYIEKGIVNYYHTTEPTRFHASIAKNLAHKVAQGEIVCNVDGDNFTGKDFAFYLNHAMYVRHDDCVLHFKKAPYWGTEGRIAMTRSNFIALGGYDESFEPIGHEDHDLINRAKAYGLRYDNIRIENFLHYLSNTTFDKAVNCTEQPTNYYDLQNRNKKRSNDNIAAGRIIANPNGWGMLPLYKNFSDTAEVFTLPPAPPRQKAG
jgi:hypothetical protein